jgi:hypothetical protein
MNKIIQVVFCTMACIIAISIILVIFVEFAQSLTDETINNLIPDWGLFWRSSWWLFRLAFALSLILPMILIDWDKK